MPYAGPSVRKRARERGIDLRQVKGSGARGRILPADVDAFATGSRRGCTAERSRAELPVLTCCPGRRSTSPNSGRSRPSRSRASRKSPAANLHRNWVMIPHVDQSRRGGHHRSRGVPGRLNKEKEKSGVRISMLAFMIKAAVAALKKFPEFNASLDGET